MQLQDAPKANSSRRGAFLVISMILLFVISIVAVALVGTSVNIGRTNQYFSQHIKTEIRALSMANYAYRILDTYQPGQFPGPGSCNDEFECNQLRSGFPFTGVELLLPYSTSSAIGPVSKIGSSRDSSWWQTYSYQPDVFLSATATNYLIVSIVGEQTSSPYDTTYRISGHSNNTATNSYGETYEMYFVWPGYQPDLGDGTCLGGCFYAQCCDSSVCGYADVNGCENSIATYTPPGWTCEGYFVAGFGYDPSVCAFEIPPP